MATTSKHVTLIDLIGKILVAGETDLAQELTAAFIEKEASLRTIRPQDMPRDEVYNFWMSPDGEIYKANKFNHQRVYDKLARRLYKDPSTAMDQGNTLYDKGWISGHHFDQRGGTLGFGYFNADAGDLTQRQIDALFDWFLALKDYWTSTNKTDKSSETALMILQKELQKQGVRTKIARVLASLNFEETSLLT